MLDTDWATRERGPETPGPGVVDIGRRSGDAPIPVARIERTS
jgi:hypothetical protein